MIQLDEGDDLTQYNFGGWLADNKQGVLGGLKVVGGTALLATGVGGAAGAGLIASGAGDIVGEIANDRADKLAAKDKVMSDPIGQPLINKVQMAEKGGMISRFKGFKHEQGGIPLFGLGAEVEDNETMSELQGDKIVHSDAFKITKKMQQEYGLDKSAIGKTPSGYSKYIDNMFVRDNDKYEQKDKIAMIGKLEKLSINKGQEAFMKRYGGRLKKMEDGGPLRSAEDIIKYFEDNDFYEYNQEMIERILSEPKTIQSRTQLANRFITRQPRKDFNDDLTTADRMFNELNPSSDAPTQQQPLNIQTTLSEPPTITTESTTPSISYGLKNEPTITTEGNLGDLGTELNLGNNTDNWKWTDVGEKNTKALTTPSTNSSLFLPTDLVSAGAIATDAIVGLRNNKIPVRSDYDFDRVSYNPVGYEKLSAQPYLNQNQSTYEGIKTQMRDSSGGSAGRYRAGLLAAGAQKGALDSQAIANIDQINSQNQLRTDMMNAEGTFKANTYNSQMKDMNNKAYLADRDTYYQRQADIYSNLAQNTLGMGRDYSNRWMANRVSPEYNFKGDLTTNEYGGFLSRYMKKYGGKIK